MKPGPLGSRIAKAVVGLLSRPTSREDRRPAPGRRTRGADQPPRTANGYPGDVTGPIDIRYAPDLDGAADPGEIVWGWIPYEDDHDRGKDRPALVIGRDGIWLLALMLTSKDKDRSGGAEDRGEVWVDIGSGAWDRERRPSEVRIDRVIRLAESGVRREGAILDRDRFDTVAAAVRRHRGE